MKSTANDYPKLKFPPINLRAENSGGVVKVWDESRRAKVVLTPEEWVRQHLIAYLRDFCGVPQRSIAVEYPVALNDMAQRADVVVSDVKASVAVLCECKAADVRIDEGVLRQALRYNSVLGARYVILTNGLRHYCYEVREGRCVERDRFPRYDEL